MVDIIATERSLFNKRQRNPLFAVSLKATLRKRVAWAEETFTRFTNGVYYLVKELLGPISADSATKEKLQQQQQQLKIERSYNRQRQRYSECPDPMIVLSSKKGRSCSLPAESRRRGSRM
jgi:hypothetical protein